jgi:hypothetical protein
MSRKPKCFNNPCNESANIVTIQRGDRTIRFDAEDSEFELQRFPKYQFAMFYARYGKMHSNLKSESFISSTLSDQLQALGKVPKLLTGVEEVRSRPCVLRCISKEDGDFYRAVHVSTRLVY